MTKIIYRLRDTEFAPFITAKIIGDSHFPYKGDRAVYEVEITDSRKPAHIQTTTYPMFDYAHFHTVFALESVA